MFYCTGADNLSAHVKHILTREGVQCNGTLSVIMFHHHWRGVGESKELRDSGKKL